MKKVVAITLAVIISALAWNYLYYYSGVLYIPRSGEPSYQTRIDQGALYVDYGNGFEEFTIRGVNVGTSMPGVYATEESVPKEEYIRWFGQIRDMGANVIRVHSIAGKEFYDALYEYNIESTVPLLLIQGIVVDDYLGNSIYGAFDKEFYEPLLESGKTMIDVIHGRHKKSPVNGFFPVFYNKDVSPWVLGYIIGSEWDNNLVVYTNHTSGQRAQYDGAYLYTENADDFEIFLAQLGDSIIKYETEKYGRQTLVSFVNWTFTDPLSHDKKIEKHFRKAARIDVEKIKTKNTLLTGQFASYHVYPSYPNFYGYLENHEENTYLQYLEDLNEHHEMPVVIAEFGIPSSRGIMSIEEGGGRNQGHMSETEQGKHLVSLYNDIMHAGCSGGIVSEWQDEWYKGSWNTQSNVDLDSTAYWNDYQSCEQSYGLLSFDPGEVWSVCYVDGETEEWTEEDLVSSENDASLYMKYDEKFIYFMIKREKQDQGKLYIPLDVTPKSGSKVAENLGITMSEAADFVIEIDEKTNSRVWVQERYDTVSALFYEEISAHNFFSKIFPEPDSSRFVKIHMLMQEEFYYELGELESAGSAEDRRLSFAEFDVDNPYHYKALETYETGLLTYGNANPSAENFNSLADFCVGEEGVEIKIPWQLLNFADPVKMYVHDDYYLNYGIEYLKIDSISVGAGNGEETIIMDEFRLEPLGKRPSYHERLKASYYILQQYWMDEINRKRGTKK